MPHPSRHWTHARHWLASAWGIVRRAPARLLLLPFLPLVAEALLQIIPSVGVIASKVLTPLVSAWVLVMVHTLVTAGRFQPRRAITHLRQRPDAVVAVVLLSLSIFAFQCLVAMALGGPGTALALATGNAAQLGLDRAGLAITLASGALPLFCLFFINPRLLLGEQPVAAAVRAGAAALRAAWQPTLLVTLAGATLVAALVWQPLLLLIVIPLAFHLNYAAYRDVFGSRSIA